MRAQEQQIELDRDGGRVRFQRGVGKLRRARLESGPRVAPPRCKRVGVDEERAEDEGGAGKEAAEASAAAAAAAAAAASAAAAAASADASAATSTNEKKQRINQKEKVKHQRLNGQSGIGEDFKTWKVRYAVKCQHSPSGVTYALTIYQLLSMHQTPSRQTRK